MFFQQIYDKSLSQASYLIGCQAKGEAIVIDAKRDIDIYLKIAEENKLTITHITETHIHADFLSGSRELAEVTGAKLYLSDEGGKDWQYEFLHLGLKNGDTINVGNLTLKVIHTPGHTPESISFLLTDHPATDEPVMIFTGDFVFVGDIGRPDLLEKAAGISGSQEKGAEEMYHSVKEFQKLPDFIQIWPGHGAGSACDKALGAVPSSTVGYEKIRNWAFQYPKDEEGFTEYLLEGQPEPPRYFAMMKKLNKIERPLLTQVPKHKKLSKEEFLKAYNSGVKIIDTRNKTDFAKGFLPKSINIQNNNSFSTWMGWLVNYSEPFILVAQEDKMEDLTRKLMRIGMDNMLGYIEEVENLGFELHTVDVIDLEEFKTYLKRENTQIIDVRNKTEYETNHIENAKNVFVGTLEDHLDKIAQDKQLVIHCQSGDRSSIAYSLLQKNGFKNVKNYSGGMKEWLEKNNPVVHS